MNYQNSAPVAGFFVLGYVNLLVNNKRHNKNRDDLIALGYQPGLSLKKVLTSLNNQKHSNEEIAMLLVQYNPHRVQPKATGCRRHRGVEIEIGRHGERVGATNHYRTAVNSIECAIGRVQGRRS